MPFLQFRRPPVLAVMTLLLVGCGSDDRRAEETPAAGTSTSAPAAEPLPAVSGPATAPDAKLAPTNEYDIRDAEMTCADANRHALRAVERLGYEVTAFTQASEAAPGRIDAGQRGAWGEDEPVSVGITCGPQGVRLAPRSEIPPCEQANRVMRRAVESSGFTVDAFQPASLSAAGRVEGRNAAGESTWVSITCYIERNRVEMDTDENSPLLENIDFYQALTDFQLGFYTAFNKYLDDAQPSGGPGDTVQVTLQPFDAVDAQIVFGVARIDPLPVKVVIANPTTRTYRLETERVTLIAASGARVEPLAGDATTFPTAALNDRPIPPGARVEGYLFYPSGTYAGARGSLADERTGEREGFRLDFQSD